MESPEGVDERSRPPLWEESEGKVLREGMERRTHQGWDGEKRPEGEDGKKSSEGGAEEKSPERGIGEKSPQGGGEKGLPR